MTTKIGGIVIDVDARVTKLEASLAKSESRWNRYEKNTKATGGRIEKNVGNINKSFSSLKGGLLALGATVGTQGLINLGKFALDFADDLGTAADRANVNVERFQTLKEVFRVLEVDAASFDKALGRLNGTLGDVQRGVQDEATKSLDAMGISTRIVNGEITTTDQLLDAIAGSSKTFGTEAEFTSAIIDIFGQRLGSQLAPALAKGTEALHEAEQAVRDAGMVVDEFSVKQLADANEAVDRFTSKSKIQFVNWAADIIDNIYAVQDAWNDVNANGLFSVRSGSQDSLESEVNQLFGLTNRAAFNRTILSGGTGTSSSAAPSIRPSSGGGRSGGRSSRPKSSAKSAGLSEAQRLTQEFEKQKLQNEQMLELQTMRFEGFELSADIQRKMYDLEARFPKLEAGRLELLKMQSAQVLIQAERYKQIGDIRDRIDGAEISGPAQQEITDQLDRLSAANLKSAGLVEFANVRIAKSFKDTADETLSAIDRMTSAIQGGGFLNILSSVIGLGLQLGSIGAFGSNVAANINAPKAYAKGTPFAPGGMAWVGEHGPELMNVPRGSEIIANNRLRGAGPNVGGASIQISPSPYFDAVVRQQAASVAAPMAVQGALGGAQLAQQQIAKRRRNNIR